MRKIREALRLHYDAGLGVRAVARSLKASPSTVREYLVRAKLQGLSWPLPESLDDAALLQRLYPTPRTNSRRLPPPQWSQVHRELRRKGVTLALLWEEYKAVHPEGMQYSWFCARYREWAAKVDVVMRFEHRAGERMFVDYAGHTVAVVERDTGELREAQIFVAVLGASNYTYAEATWTQALPDWIASHVRAFQFMGGSTELLIPDDVPRNIMNRLLLVVRSRANKSIEVSRGVGAAPAYGESKRFLGVDQVTKVMLTARDGGNVGSNPRSGEVLSLVGGS